MVAHDCHVWLRSVQCIWGVCHWACICTQRRQQPLKRMLHSGACDMKQDQRVCLWYRPRHKLWILRTPVVKDKTCDASLISVREFSVWDSDRWPEGDTELWSVRSLERTDWTGVRLQTGNPTLPLHVYPLTLSPDSACWLGKKNKKNRMRLKSSSVPSVI